MQDVLVVSVPHPDKVTMMWIHIISTHVENVPGQTASVSNV